MILHRPDSHLSGFSRFVEANMGLHFPPERLGDLERGISSAAQEFGFSNVTECIEWLMSARLSKTQMEVLASHLTIGETYFFRDKRMFELLEQEILPELARSRQAGERQVRIWSAACCTGEEPYSIAISVRKAMPNLADWHVTILGTDINPRFLRKAADGVYTEWSFRDTPPRFKETYFKRIEEGRWEIRPEIRKMVNFLQINLAEDAYPSLLNNTNAIDLIVCRNVLIYFSSEQAQRVIRKLTNCLKEGGWLALGPNETVQASLPGLVVARLRGAILYRKNAQEPTRSDDRISQLQGEPSSISRPFLPSGSPQTEPLLDSQRAKPVQRIDQVAASSLSGFKHALNCYKDGAHAEAAEALREHTSFQPCDSKSLTLLTRALANQGKLAEALAVSERLIAADKMNPTGHYLRASILQEQGDPIEAESSLKRSLYLDPEFVLAHFALGNVALSQGKASESERHFGNALELARAHAAEDILPEGEGLTTGRLAEIITTLTGLKSVPENE